MANKIYKDIPRSENGTGVLCITRSGIIYKITQNEKKRHTLWLVHDDGFEKIASSDSPYDLYDLIDMEK